MRKFTILAVIGICLIALNGCVAVAAGVAGGAGAAAWLSGKLGQDVNASYSRVVSASRSGLETLGLEITKETADQSITQLKSVYEDGREVWVDIRPITDTTSRIEVRVGAMGDKEASERIMTSILSYL